MPAASRHAKPKTPAIRFGALAVAAATLAGVAAAFVFLPGRPAAPGSSRHAIAATSEESGLATDQMTTDQMITAVRRHVATLETRQVQRVRAAAQRKRRAALAAAQQAQQQAASQPAPSASASPSPAPPPSSSGGNAADSPLGICIRNAEEGGSYAWGPGNGGGAYQFLLGTWETYGGAASEFGVAGPAYQDQIFDNAIAAGDASAWTNYDGC
jgi:hypothetical protein